MASENVDIIFRLRDQASQGLRNIGRSLRNTRDGMMSAGRTAGIFAAALGGIIFAAARAGATQRRAVAGLRAGINALGGDVDALVPKVEAATAALQRKTNFGDEEQIRALTRMLPIFGSVEKALEALPVVLDAATLSETDLATAAENVARVIDAGEGRILRTIDATRKARILAAPPAERLGLLAGAFAGQAEAAATGTIQFKNALGDLLELLQIDIALDKIGTALMGFTDSIAGVDSDAMAKVGQSLLVLFAGMTLVAGAAGIAAIASISVLAGWIILVGLALLAVVLAVTIWRDETIAAFDAGILKANAFFDIFPDFISTPLRMILEDLTSLPLGVLKFIDTVLDPEATVWDIAISFGELGLPDWMVRVLKGIGEGNSIWQILTDVILGALPEPIRNLIKWFTDGGIQTVWDIVTDPGEWIPRIWNWVRRGTPFRIFFAILTGGVSEILMFIWNWFRKGLDLVLKIDVVGNAVDFIKSLNPFGGSSGGGGSDQGETDREREARRHPGRFPGETHSEYRARLGPGHPPQGLATGGIVRSRTFAMLGESGPEAVIPLPASGIMGGLTVNVIMPPNGTVILDNEASARRLAVEVMNLIRAQLRTQRPF